MVSAHTSIIIIKIITVTDDRGLISFILTGLDIGHPEQIKINKKGVHFERKVFVPSGLHTKHVVVFARVAGHC